MRVDIDDLRAEIKNLEREGRKGLREETSVGIRATYSGILVDYKKIERMLDEMEEDYRKQDEEYSRSLMEEQQ